MKDKQGREYANLADLQEGDIIELDDGFTCTTRARRRVLLDDQGRLCFECNEGTHLLEGQLDFDGSDALIGIYPVKEA